MLIDRNDYTNSELEEMGLPLDDFDDPDDDFDPDFDIIAPPFDDEWVDEYDSLIEALYYRDIA